MTVTLAILLASILVFLLAGRYYARFIGRLLGETPNRPTPAVEINDGLDFVPTRTPIVFAHHFASIAGAGPIVGPVLGIMYGWGPALLWIVLGGIFLGAVHDYASAFVSMREGGRSLATIARRHIGKAAFIMMLVMLVAILTLVCAAFLDLSATALTSQMPVEQLELKADSTLFRVHNGQALVGGIASTSVVVITAFAPLVGFLYIKRKWPVSVCSALALLICGLSIWVGLCWPMNVTAQTWKALLSVYVLFAAGLPVWLFLQSRDFINVHILYAGIVLLVAAVIMAAWRGGMAAIDPTEAIPMLNWQEGSRLNGPGWPVLFITIACGAVSGFHSLCAGGTTCKQLNREVAARQVGYYAMLLESFLAVCVICCLLVGLSYAQYQGFCYPGNGKGNAVLTFAIAVGRTVNLGLGLPVAFGTVGAMLLLEGFLVTTLDTAIRLTRYVIEEGWNALLGNYDVFAARTLDIDAADSSSRPASSIIATRGPARLILRLLSYYWFNCAIAVGLMLALGWGKGYNVLWSIFGSANQLLAAIALVIVSLWLVQQKRPVWFALLPALFMTITSATMLVRLLWVSYIPAIRAGNGAMIPLAIADVIILAMTAGIILLAWRKYSSAKTATA